MEIRTTSQILKIVDSRWPIGGNLMTTKSLEFSSHLVVNE